MLLGAYSELNREFRGEFRGEKGREMRIRINLRPWATRPHVSQLHGRMGAYAPAHSRGALVAVAGSSTGGFHR